LSRVRPGVVFRSDCRDKIAGSMFTRKLRKKDLFRRPGLPFDVNNQNMQKKVIEALISRIIEKKKKKERVTLTRFLGEKGKKRGKKIWYPACKQKKENLIVGA